MMPWFAGLSVPAFVTQCLEAAFQPVETKLSMSILHLLFVLWVLDTKFGDGRQLQPRLLQAVLWA